MGNRREAEGSATYERFRRMRESAYEEADGNLSNCEADHPFAQCERRMAALCGMVEAGSIKGEAASESLIRLVVEADEIRRNEALRIMRGKLRGKRSRRAAAEGSNDAAGQGGDGEG